MKNAVAGAVLAAGLVIAALGGATSPTVGFAQRAMPSQSSGGGLITHSAVADGRQQLTVIHPDMHVISVYHIDLATGEITLKSVRRIHWDLQMDEFNGTSPLPREVRALVEQK